MSHECYGISLYTVAKTQPLGLTVQSMIHPKQLRPSTVQSLRPSAITIKTLQPGALRMSVLKEKALPFLKSPSRINHAHILRLLSGHIPVEAQSSRARHMRVCENVLHSLYTIVPGFESVCQ